MSFVFRFLTLGLFCVASALSSLRAATTEIYGWKNVVIKGGGFVSGLAYHPNTPDVFYARTDVGGAYRWLPASKSWLPLNDALGKDDSQIAGVVSIGLDPRDANRVYLACGQYLPSWAQAGAILSSTDQGLTWSRTNLSVKLGGNSDGRSTGERLQVDPNLGSILFLGTNQDGLWKSTDRSQTWSKIGSFSPTSVTLVLFDPRSGTAGNATPTIYVGVNSITSDALYRSTDGGSTWAPVPGQPSGLMPHHAKFSADGTLYLTYGNALGPNSVTAGAVWKLKTSDGSWTNITPTPAGQGGFAGLALDMLHPGTLVVTTLDRWSPRDEIYRSTDSGATWKALNASSTHDGSSAPYSNGSTPHWLGAIEIDPFNSNRAFYITGYGLFGTETLTAADANATITWIFRNDGLEETVPLGLVSPSSGAPLVSIVGDIDGFRHDDLTVSPARHSPAVGTNNSLDFAELAPSVMVRTHGGGTVHASRSTDGGATWSYFAAAPASATSNNEGAIAISPDASRLVWAPTHAIAYYSLDNGASWTASTGGPAASADTSYTPVSDRVNSSKFYLYDSVAGRVYYSTNGGNSYSASSTTVPTGASSPRSVPGNEGHLWLPAWSSGLYRSTDSGATFAKFAGVQEGYRIGFGKAAAGQTYPAIFLWGKVNNVVGIFRSDDAGANWTRINDGAHQYGWINAMTGDPRVYGRVYLATGGRGIIYGDLTNSVPTIVWPTPGALAAGVALSANQLNANTSVAGTFTYSPALGTILPIGTHVLNVTFTPTDTVTYTTATAQVNLTVYDPNNVPATRLVNISTRAYCSTGNNVTIGGFVISGTAAKRVLVRAVGPTLASQGINAADVLADPTIEVYQGSTKIATNDNWGDNANPGEITSLGTQLGANALSLTDVNSSALILSLSPGAYTFIVKGKNDASGIVLLEVYDADANGVSTFANISARAYCTTGDRVAIGGFVIAGTASKKVLLRAVGPTLATVGVPSTEVMVDPVIELHRASPVLAANDDSGTNANAAEIISSGARVGALALAATDGKSAALLLDLAPGPYTFIANGKNGGSGIVLVEVYDVD